jgi:spoIIIJ-associated protein
MSTYKEFQGKNLDEAIQEACDYFGVERERLEVEILNDAKTGIFGLVGTKKARIRAAKVQLGTSLSSLLDSPEAGPGNNLDEPSNEPSPRSASQNAPRPPRSTPNQGSGRNKPAPAPAEDRSAARARQTGQVRGVSRACAAEDDEPAAGAPCAQGREREKNAAPRPGKRGFEPRAEGRPCPCGPRQEESGQGGGESALNEQARKKNIPCAGGVCTLPSDIQEPAGTVENQGEDLPVIDLGTCDLEALFSCINSTVTRLVLPIVGEMTCAAEIAGNRVKVAIDCGDAAGILLGREGQTLAAVQYVATRIIARTMGGAVRLQFDVGNYRERQDERLRELALSLAEKAKASKRAQSTRPLSPYQRRIIHLALEGDPAVQTHSTGEGMQRRVIIKLRRCEDSGPEADE